METLETFDVKEIRKDFPILNEKVNGNNLIYFDNGATTQKPQQMLDKVQEYYSKLNSNVHRGVHTLSQLATEEYEGARETVRQFMNAKSTNEIVFTKGTTDSINLAAYTIGKKYINEGDEILITQMEHHSNIVPWQMIADEKNAKLKYIPVTDNSELDYSKLDELITERTKVVSLVHVSNSLGTLNDVKKVITKSHSVGAKLMIDGAQSVQHIPIDVQDLNCDFYCFSGHKLYGPLGIGILFGKEELLEELPPYQGGGEMITEVTMEKTTYNELPYKFEAGTPNIVGAIGLGASIDYINSIGLDNIDRYEDELLAYANDKIDGIDGSIRYNKSAINKSILPFNFDGVFHFDLGMFLDKMGVAVRTGHHCSQPVMKRFDIQGTIRASFSFYNTKEEIDYFVQAIEKSLAVLR
ncbi:MAG: aminotransferase class V-fold PLP-dependent enzyme [Chlorobiota bacterium]